MKLEDAREFWRSRGVPEEAMDDLSDLAEAARYNDARAEEQSGADTNGLVAFLRDGPLGHGGCSIASLLDNFYMESAWCLVSVELSDGTTT